MTGTTLTQAPLTSEERSYLKRACSGEGFFAIVLNFLMGACFVGVLFYVPAYVLWRWIGPFGRNDETILLVAAAIVGAVPAALAAGHSIRDRIAQRTRPNPFRTDLDGGVANVLAADVTRAVEIEQFEDEGTGFFLELSDGRVFCVIGQDLDDFSDDAEFEEGEEDVRDQFPQTRIEYRYAPESGYRLNIKGVGEPLRPFGRVKTTRKFFTKGGYSGPEGGEFYDGPIEAVLEKFGYKFQLLR